MNDHKPQVFLYDTHTITVTRVDGGYEISAMGVIVRGPLRNALMFMTATGVNTLMADGVFVTRVRESSPLVNKK